MLDRMRQRFEQVAVLPRTHVKAQRLGVRWLQKGNLAALREAVLA